MFLTGLSDLSLVRWVTIIIGIKTHSEYKISNINRDLRLFNYFRSDFSSWTLKWQHGLFNDYGYIFIGHSIWSIIFWRILYSSKLLIAVMCSKNNWVNISFIGFINRVNCIKNWTLRFLRKKKLVSKLDIININ